MNPPTDATIRAALREGAIVAEDAVHTGAFRLRLTPPTAALARYLAVGIEWPNNLAALAPFHDAALVDRVVDFDNEGSLRIQMLLPSFAFRTDPMPSGVVASPYASASFESGVMIVEDPAAGVRIRVRGNAVAAVAQLLAGTSRAEGVVAGELWSARVLVEAGTASRTWEPHDLAMHCRSRLGRTDAPYGSTWRLRGLIPPPPALIAPRGPLVALPQIADAPRRDFFEVLEARRSSRAFAPLTAAQLGELLHRAAGLRALTGDEAWPATERPYPSGGRVYELEIYVAGACEGLPSGLYRYVADRHAMEHRLAAASDVSRLLADAARCYDPGVLPPVLLIFSARIARVAYKYGSIAYALVLKHVGVLQQTICLAAEALDLAACPLGGGNSELFARAAGVDPLEEPSVGEIVVGARNG